MKSKRRQKIGKCMHSPRKLMSLELRDVEATIFKMDNHYDANFGSWIRNEKNAAVVGYHLNKYIDDYNPCDFIVVVKWIVRSWTLRSIIVLSKSMASHDIQHMDNSRKSETYRQLRNRVCILSGLTYTWNSFFIVEFLTAFSKGFSTQQKCKFFVNLLSYFSLDRNKVLIGMLSEKVEQGVCDILVRAFVDRKPRAVRRKRRIHGELVAAFHVS